MKKLILLFLILSSLLFVGCEEDLCFDIGGTTTHKYSSLRIAYEDHIVYYGMTTERFNEVMVKPDTTYTYTDGTNDYTVFLYNDGNAFFSLDKLCGIVLNFN